MGDSSEHEPLVIRQARAIIEGSEFLQKELQYIVRLNVKVAQSLEASIRNTTGIAAYSDENAAVIAQQVKIDKNDQPIVTVHRIRKGLVIDKATGTPKHDQHDAMRLTTVKLTPNDIDVIHNVVEGRVYFGMVEKGIYEIPPHRNDRGLNAWVNRMCEVNSALIRAGAPPGKLYQRYFGPYAVAQV